MRRFVLGWKMLGMERNLGSRIVTYADDFVILCRKGNAEKALQRLREIMGKLKLTVNEEKTRVRKVPAGEFDFLGCRFEQMCSARTGKAYKNQTPRDGAVSQPGGVTTMKHDSTTLRAETFAIQAVLTNVFFELKKLDPVLAEAIARGF